MGRTLLEELGERWGRGRAQSSSGKAALLSGETLDGTELLIFVPCLQDIHHVGSV